MAVALFSPHMQHTVSDIQMQIRRIESSLSASATQVAGDCGFAYSFLSGCSAFLNSEHLDAFPQEVQEFAKQIVQPMVADCLQAIHEHDSHLPDPRLKLAILKRLNKVQYFPKTHPHNTLITVRDPVLMEELAKVIQMGTYTLYMLNDQPGIFFGGRLDIAESSFKEVGHILERYHYKEPGDVLGAAPDLKGHVTTIEPRELTARYDAILKAHDAFTQVTQVATLKPVSLSFGTPQSGRLARVVVINVQSNEIDEYRTALGLKPLTSLQLSVFSQNVQPLPELYESSILDFIQVQGKKNSSPPRMKMPFSIPKKVEEGENEPSVSPLAKRRQIACIVTIGACVFVGGLIMNKMRSEVNL